MNQKLRDIGMRAVVSASLLIVPGAYAQQVTTDFDHNAQFENYHTFSFVKIQTENPLYQQRLHDDIAHDLQSHGLQMVPSGGDLAVTAIGGVHDQQEYNTFYSGLGPGFGRRGWGGWGGGWGGDSVTNTTVQQVPIGTLLVDLYDTRSHNLVFRARAIENVKKNTEKNIGTVQKAVNKMFDHFPPKHSM